MEGYNNIIRKLNEFTRRFYLKQLVKGTLLFLSLGLLFFLAVMSLEYTLWLNQNWRLVLFLIFVLVELSLLYKFILIPIFYLFKVKKGLSYKEAAKLIGKHFPNIDDKLYNLLELSENQERSELLLASIEQKSQNLDNFTFAKAVDFKESMGYAKYAIAPILIITIIWLSGDIASFFSSYTRVVNYDMAYEQPAPFTFRVLNDKLNVLDNEPLTVQVEIIGDVKPENVFLVIDGEQLLLQKSENIFTYTFEAPVSETDFYLTANGWDSKDYTIRSFRTPSVVDFKMNFVYPKYLRRISDMITGTGNAVVPEGTKVIWEIEGQNVDEIKMTLTDTTIAFVKNENSFINSNHVYNNFSYELSTSNTNVKDFERLGYQLEVIKDAFPVVEVEQILDSINPNQSFFTGQASDDYRVNKIQVVSYPLDDREDVQRIVLESPKTNVHQFYYTFPSGFKLEDGRNYKLFFEVIDNDGLRNGKITKSRVFDATLLNVNQLKNKELEFQNNVLNNLDKSLEKYKEQQETLSKINDKQKEENSLNFDDKNEIKDFLHKQEEQEQLMEKFSRQLKESLNNEEGSEEMKKMLQERLERQELEARKNEKLLEELNKLSEKINKEELKKKLEELGKKQSSGARNLEQILELTKRYYVTEKMAQLSKALEKLSEKQEELSNDSIAKQEEKEQEELNKDFQKLSEEIDELKKDNDRLKKPMDIEVSDRQQQSIKSDQEDALNELQKKSDAQNSDKQSGNDAKKAAAQKQKSAAQKMKEMSQSMQQSAMGGGGSSDTEDAEMLRQILDNLVTFSFKQENLLDNVENVDTDISQFSRTVRDQKELRRLFEHVDDSLFALSLRRVELSEFVNEQITEVYYNIDKSLESIADNQVYQGASYQQYVVNATNALADFLANVLDNMQQSMQSGQGSGQGGGDFQLPDIIQGQEGIGKKMNSPGQGKNGKPNQTGKEGEGKNGESENGSKGGEKDAESSNSEGDGKQNGHGKKEGSQEGGGDGGSNEMGLSEIYEIYKEQQYLRQQLEKQLQDMIDSADRNLAKKLIRQMENFENDLLENGITQRTQSKANIIQHQLLKLKNAALKQGKQKERKSNTNLDSFTNPIITKPDVLRKHSNDIEILNRQVLPLRQNYDKKVKVYFKND
ncbi:hypothetical protein [Flagellimonas sp. S3867]|uniref:hypothetical protein n=1 Tax=Flagellimonas sp. S3867 TaxID=2768063 RepID=UPI0016821629|nr:hypothetical protein [Flagellimonas sp. S3867]